MSSATISDTELLRDRAYAKQATVEGPLLVTDGGEPAYALLKIKDYYELTGEGSKPRIESRTRRDTRTLLEVMDSLPGGDFEFEPPRLRDLGFKPAEFE